MSLQTLTHTLAILGSIHVVWCIVYWPLGVCTCLLRMQMPILMGLLSSFHCCVSPSHPGCCSPLSNLLTDTTHNGATIRHSGPHTTLSGRIAQIPHTNLTHTGNSDTSANRTWSLQQIQWFTRPRATPGNVPLVLAAIKGTCPVHIMLYSISRIVGPREEQIGLVWPVGGA